jgi:hypothetical protein
MSKTTSALHAPSLPEPKPSEWREAFVAKAPVVVHDTPNLFVRLTFYTSVIAIFPGDFYIPGTGDRLGINRIVQLMMVTSMLWQPRVCLRRIPVAMLWFLAYYFLKVIWGYWLTPDLYDVWMPSVTPFFFLMLPILWLSFNVIQDERVAMGGLWMFTLTCAFCALLHVMGIGTQEIGSGETRRITIFGENANEVGVAYAVALVASLGLALRAISLPWQRLLMVPVVLVLGIALSKTGSRSAVLAAGAGMMILALPCPALIATSKRVALVLGGGLIFGFILSQTPVAIQRFKKLQDPSENATEARARMLPVMWDIGKRTPVFGSGPARYQRELTRRAMPYLIRERMNISAHNLLMALFLETGIIGVVVFGWGLILTLIAAWRARRCSLGIVPFAMLLPLFLLACTSNGATGNPVFWFAITYCLAVSFWKPLQAATPIKA